MMKDAKRLVCGGVLFIFMVARAGAADVKPSSIVAGLSPAQGPYDIGLIFSTGSVLLDLESYQAGIGAKIGGGKACLRGSVDLLASGASRSFSILVGATGQYYLAPGPVSPYIGIYAQAGYMNQSDLISVVPVSVGAVAGVEVFLFEFLSVFAEYCLAVDVSVTTDGRTSETTFDYLVDTRMGNDSQLGIVIYFSRVGAKR